MLSSFTEFDNSYQAFSDVENIIMSLNDEISSIFRSNIYYSDFNNLRLMISNLSSTIGVLIDIKRSIVSELKELKNFYQKSQNLKFVVRPENHKLSSTMHNFHVQLADVIAYVERQLKDIEMRISISDAVCRKFREDLSFLEENRRKA